jgi:uncharacterized Zn-binding protein involved in type VI secretion
MVTVLVPHVGGPIIPPCCPTVIVCGMPQARVTDMATCVGPPDVIVKGSFTVFVGGLQAARLGDLTAHGGVIVTGCPTVIIGDAPSFSTQLEAARAALQFANPQSIADNLEYGGMIFQNPDGTFSFTMARGTDAGFNPSDAPAPPGTTVVGDYHCHADYSLRDPVTGRAIRTSDPARDDYNSDNFSATDRTGITNDARGNPAYRGYLGTPSGTFREFDPNTGTTRDI